MSLAVTQTINKRTIAQKKACLPSACPLLARCRLLACPRLSAPPRWFETLWGGEVRGERRWEGGKRHPHRKNAHTIKPGVLVPLTASLEGDRATHTDDDGYRVLQILRSTLPRLDQRGESCCLRFPVDNRGNVARVHARLIGRRSVGRSVGGSVGRSIGRSVDRSVGRSVGLRKILEGPVLPPPHFPSLLNPSPPFSYSRCPMGSI